MKINGSNSIVPMQSIGQSPRSVEQRGASGAAQDSDQVHLSGDARWISALQAEARSQPAVRPERVAEVQAQLVDGSFEGSVDMNAVLDGLLADL